MFHSGKRHEPIQAGRPVRLLVWLLFGALGSSGCGVWDEFRANDYSVKAFFVPEDPMVVLRDSNDGNKRARALGALREPKQHGGSDQEQEVVLKVLVTASSREPQAYCRLRAIESLSTFKDPRASEGLKEAYYASKDFAPTDRTAIRCLALQGLGQVGHPAGVDLLVTVLRAPPSEPSANSEQDQQLYLEERLAAARALENFKHYQATEALVAVLKTEKDPSLRGRAHQSLQVATGKRLPADAKAWDELLHPAGEGVRDAVVKQPATPPKKASILAPIIPVGNRGTNGRP